MTVVNATQLPPLPEYTLSPRPLMFSPIPDSIFILIPPVVVYWVVSLIFHWVDVNDFFRQYRLHTPIELLQRNHVSKGEVVRDVLVQHLIQTLSGVVLALIDEPEYTGKDGYNIAVWATRLRIAQSFIPAIASVLGLDTIGLAKKLVPYPTLVSILTGGKYDASQKIVSATGESVVVPAFASWELTAASAIYYYLIPTIQFTFATLIVDSWQYFLHRAMHVNKWLYTSFHSRHHRLYVPYAFGALYNHWVEGFLLDTAGTGLAYLVTGLSYRQAVCFFTGSTLKTVDDHCGYKLPFDPLQLITSNNAAYHDIHHQSWGIKTNFAQPFFTFWDRLLKTRYEGPDPGERYARDRKRAEDQVSKQKQQASNKEAVKA